MFDHVTLRVPDLEEARRFYTAVLATLGHGPPGEQGGYVQWGDFSLAQADDSHPATRGVHIGFVAPSIEAIEAFWRTGIDAGYPDDGAPGPRPIYGPDYHGGFLLDRPDGGAAANSVEAVRHGNLRWRGAVDHLWIRVADLGAMRAEFERMAPLAGLRLVAELEDRVRFTGTEGSGGSISLVADGRPHAAHVEIRFASGITLALGDGGVREAT